MSNGEGIQIQQVLQIWPNSSDKFDGGESESWLEISCKETAATRRANGGKSIIFGMEKLLVKVKWKGKSVKSVWFLLLMWIFPAKEKVLAFFHAFFHGPAVSILRSLPFIEPFFMISKSVPGKLQFK